MLTGRFQLFHRFDFSIVNPIEPFQWNNQGFTKSEHMNVKITKRESVVEGDAN